MSGDAREAARRRWLGLLARAPTVALADAWEALPARPEVETLRAPQPAMVMVEARAGGTGARFNLGHAAVTRCVVRIGAATGVGYVQGHDLLKAALVARFDALMQGEAGAALEASLVGPLERAQAEAAARARRRAAATRVEFFTMERASTAGAP